MQGNVKGRLRCARSAGGRRRGVALVQVAAASTVLIGFAALAIDVGYLYDVRAELQRTADAAAMAAAMDLGNYTDGDPLVKARESAQDFATRNKMMKDTVLLDPAEDVIFGRAEWDSITGTYSFTPTEAFPNAVRVRARRTEDSPNGAVSLFFANVFGVSRKDMRAEATALLTPRDIAMVLDLSGSHNDDSSLVSYKRTNTRSRDVWSYLWDDALAQAQGVTRPLEDGMPTGPRFGNMRTWGTTNAEPGWDFAADAGLQRLAKSSNWTLTSATASTTLTDKGYGSYNAAEMTAINSSAYDGTTADYQRRVLVALGVYRWKSGKAGGQAGGNGDNRIDAGEIQTMIAYPSAASNPATFSKKVGGSWTAFVDYVSNSGSNMCKYDPSQDQYGDAGLRYRFGLKTFVDYLQEKCYGDSSSPGFGGAPTQPMGAVIDATNTALTVISDLQSNDLVGLAGYGTVGYSPADKPSGLSWLTDDMAGLNTKVSKFQAAMWTTNTNMAQGIDKGADVLMDSPDARPHAAKIMLLLTDGKPNQTRANPTQYYSEFSNPNPAATDAVAAATEARAQGIRIYTISVGVNADSDLMQQIASIGAGEHFHAEGSIEAYQAQLQDIFEDLGGKRPVQLIGSR